MKLSREDGEEIGAALSRLNVAGHVRERGAAALIRDWAQFVQEVRDGYSDDEYEYRNDLSVRDIIQSVLDRLSLPVRSRLEAEVAPMDELYLATTIGGSGPRHRVYGMMERRSGGYEIQRYLRWTRLESKTVIPPRAVFGPPRLAPFPPEDGTFFG